MTYVYCPYCGSGHRPTRREEMYIDLNGYCARMCTSCRQTYYFDHDEARKEKKNEDRSI